MTLTCPLPEEQNTRGRKIYPPEESLQGFGILTTKEIPPVSFIIQNRNMRLYVRNCFRYVRFQYLLDLEKFVSVLNYAHRISIWMTIKFTK